jgi:tRNA U34 2-thiouridine synthase MnmA/TrmU
MAERNLSDEIMTGPSTKKVRAIGLLSGGLDSILATRLMLEQDVDVLAVHFVLPFCECQHRGQGDIQAIAGKIGVPLKIIRHGQDFVDMLKAPRYGYGRHINPCIDCRIFNLKKAKELMEHSGADFVFTGEVLGQRPMSQRKDAMRIVERDSGLDGYLLRPLSARLMKPTVPEEQGLVDRGRLLAIQGRTRSAQIALAETYGIDYYPGPAGGCLLTEKEFARRLQDLFQHGEDSLYDINLLTLGRHFRLPTGEKIVAGRDEDENRRLEAYAAPTDYKFSAERFGSPLVILRKTMDRKAMEQAAAICARYSSGREQDRISVRYWLDCCEPPGQLVVAPMADRLLETYRL